MTDPRCLRRSASLFHLLVLACVMSGWPGLALAVPPTNMYDEFRSIISTRMVGPFGEKGLEKMTVTRDDKNGYLRFRMEEGAKAVEYTFVYWLKGEGPSQSRVFGFWEVHDDVAMSDHRISFWKHENEKWIQLKDVLPKIGVKDVWDEKKPLPKPVYQRLIKFDYELPRHGTTIKVTLRSLSRGDVEGEFLPDSPEEDFGYDERTYQQVWAEVKYREIDLVWNRKTGRFAIGAKTEGKADEEPP